MMKLKKCICPAPVYEAHYADGKKLRMSFTAFEKELIDPEAGKDFCNLIYAGGEWDRLNAERVAASYPPAEPKCKDFTGHEEYEEYMVVCNEHNDLRIRRAKACVKLQDALRYERAAFVRANQNSAPFVGGFIEHHSIGRLAHSVLLAENAAKKKNKTPPRNLKALNSKLLMHLKVCVAEFAKQKTIDPAKLEAALETIAEAEAV
jgi:hypothetical protein